jgi:hypothetical protein
MVGPYDIGDQPIITGTFEDVDGTPTDPTDIDVIVREPDGTETSYDDSDMTHVSTGVWSFQIPSALDSCGIWTVKFFGTAGLVAAQEVSFKVRCSRIN